MLIVDELNSMKDRSVSLVLKRVSNDELGGHINMDIERSLGVITALDEHQISHPVLHRMPRGKTKGAREKVVYEAH